MEKKPTSAKASAGGETGMPAKASAKARRYFKYAIGEIILVVIGILIALQINNWNNQRIERIFESSILKEILSNIDFDLEHIESQIRWNEIYGNHNEIIYEHLKNKTPLTDSLKYSYSYLYGYGDFLPMTVAYENLKSEGINIIRKEDLRKSISRLYEYEYRKATTQLLETIVHLQERHTNEINDHIIMEKWYESAKPADLEALQNNIQFQQTLKAIAMARKYSNRIFKSTKKDILEVKMSIEKELGIPNE